MERKDGESTHPNKQENADRPLAIVRGHAQAAAQKAGTTMEFFWTQMNYHLLVPKMEALMEPDAICQSCGHAFVNELDIELDHRLPPRHPQDWARMHAQNLWFLCASCHHTKGAKPFQDWLDEQEAARLSNLQSQREAGRVV